MEELEVKAQEKAEKLVELLNKNSMHISFAESCTGGLLAKLITDVSGASNVFECGFVTYSNRIKTEVLHIPTSFIEKYGVVSAEVAGRMAKAAREKSSADIGIGITGVAGPGPDGSIPEGTIYIGFSVKNKETTMAMFTGTENQRNYNRYCAAINAFSMAIEYLENI